MNYMNSLSRGAATMRRRVSMQEAEGDEMRQINIEYCTWKIFIVDIFTSCNYLYFYIIIFLYQDAFWITP